MSSTDAKTVLFTFILSLSYIPFIIWLYMFTVDLNYIEHIPTEISPFDYDGIINGLLGTALLFLLLSATIGRRLYYISSLISAVLWVLLGIVYISFGNGAGLSVFTAYPYKIAVFIKYNGLLFLLCGSASLFQFCSSVVLYMKWAGKGGPRDFFPVFIPLWTLLIGISSSYLFGWLLFPGIAFIAGTVPFIYGYSVIGKTSASDSSVFDTSRYRYGMFGTGFGRILADILSSLFMGTVYILTLFYLLDITTVPFRFTSVSTALVYISCGWIIYPVIYRILSDFGRKKYESAEKKESRFDRIPYLLFIKKYAAILGALLILYILSAIMLDYYTFSDSTYLTDYPFMPGVFIGGFVLGLLTHAPLFVFGGNNVLSANGDRSGSSRIYIVFSEIIVTLFAILSMIASVAGFMRGLEDAIFKKGFGETLYLGKVLLPVFCGVVAVIYIIELISFRRVKNPDTFYTSRSAGVSFPHRGSVAKGVKIAGILLCVIFTGILPIAGGSIYGVDTDGELQSLKPSPDIPFDISDMKVGYPVVLGQISDCIVTEVSPFTAVGRHIPVIGAAPGPISENIIRKRSARNDFTPIQIVLSNNGPYPVKIEGIAVLNSTHGNYKCAFALPPFKRDWKGEVWDWPRVSAYIVDIIREGYPDILYPLPLYVINGTISNAGYVNGIGEVGNLTEPDAADIVYKYTPDVGAVQYYKEMNRSLPEPVIEPFSSRALWFTLYTGEDIDAGYYSDIISVITNRFILNLTVEMKVWNFTLPRTPKFRTAIGNRAVYYLPNRDEWNKNFLMHKMSPYFPFNLRELYKRNGTEIFFNFTEFEWDLENAVANGLNSFRLNFAPSRIGLDAFTSDFNATAVSFYFQIGEFLENHSLNDGTGRTWADLALVYAMDEPNPEDYPYFVKWSRLVHSASPFLKVLLTEQVEPEINGSVDIWCPFIDSLNPHNIELQHAAGKEFWYYTCCSVSNEPTVLYTDPKINHIAIFWTAWAYNFDGYLFWDAAAYVGRDCYNPYYLGYNEIGDAVMLLNDASYKPINTPVWELMREGVEDTDYMNILAELEPDSPILAYIGQKWSSFTEFPRNPVDYTVLRYLMGERIDMLVSNGGA